MATVLVRMDDDLKERLRVAAFERRESQNAIIIRALERELADGE